MGILKPLKNSWWCTNCCPQPRPLKLTSHPCHRWGTREPRQLTFSSQLHVLIFLSSPPQRTDTTVTSATSFTSSTSKCLCSLSFQDGPVFHVLTSSGNLSPSPNFLLWVSLFSQVYKHPSTSWTCVSPTLTGLLAFGAPPTPRQLQRPMRLQNTTISLISTSLKVITNPTCQSNTTYGPCDPIRAAISSKLQKQSLRVLRVSARNNACEGLGMGLTVDWL